MRSKLSYSPEDQNWTISLFTNVEKVRGGGISGMGMQIGIEDADGGMASISTMEMDFPVDSGGRTDPYPSSTDGTAKCAMDLWGAHGFNKKRYPEAEDVLPIIQSDGGDGPPIFPPPAPTP